MKFYETFGKVSLVRIKDAKSVVVFIISIYLYLRVFKLKDKHVEEGL